MKFKKIQNFFATQKDLLYLIINTTNNKKYGEI